MKDIGETSLRASLCGLAIVFLGIGAAEATSPAYCALYAREYTAQFATGSSADAAMASEYKILEQAYYQCLNMDMEPEFPQTSVYYGEGLNDILGGMGGPLDVAQGDTSGEDVVGEPPAAEVATAEPAPAEQAAPEPKPTQTASAAEPRRKGRGGSGFEAWTPEWEAWCRKHFPNSFDPADGTVKPYGEGRRFCN